MTRDALARNLRKACIDFGSHFDRARLWRLGRLIAVVVVAIVVVAVVGFVRLIILIALIVFVTALIFGAWRRL